MAGKPDKGKEKEKDKHELIIVRRLEEEEHERHNTAWKVAHADFMTAMMAFFLIMWLINVTDEETRKGISAYFNPVHLSAAQKGLEDEGKKPGAGQATKGKSDPTPDKKTASDKTSDKTSDKKAGEKGKGGPADSPGKTGADITEGKSENGGAGKAQKDLVGFGKTTGGLSEAPGSAGAELTEAEVRERAAFHDPYAVLGQLAAAYTATRTGGGDAVVGDDRVAGLPGGPSERDPFDPVYWQTTPGEPYKTDQPGAAGKTPQIPAGSFDAAATQSPVEQPPPLPPDQGKGQKKPADAGKVAADKTDPAAMVRETAREIDAEVRQTLGPDLGGTPSPRLKVEASGDGVVISLTDGADFSMFDLGSAIPNGKVVFILSRIADMLAKKPGKIVIRGFTDARPFRSNIYDNWRLSAERAHMAYYMLVRGGIDENRISRIEGYADRSLKNDKDPNAAENRRIEILLERPQS